MAEPVKTTHKAEQELGPPISLAEGLRWASASLLTKFEPDSDSGCPRRGWLHYVGSLLGISTREPETAAMSAGTGDHKEIETYLLGGARPTSPTVVRAMAIGFVDEPGKGLQVEFPILSADKVHLRVAGVPYAGHIDLLNHRGWYVNSDGELRADTAKTVEIKDWKTTSDLKWAKNPEQVANAIPMTGYAMAAFAIWPEYEHARLTHVYMQRRSPHPSLLSTSRRSREQVARRWDYATSIARAVVDIALERELSKVPCNTRACHSYGKPCTYLSICDQGRAASSHKSIESALGPRLAALVSGNIKQAFKKEQNMGLIKNIANKPSTPAPVNPAPEQTEMSLDDLEAEEEAARVEHAVPTVQVPQEWADAWTMILASSLGRPALGGESARLYNALCGIQHAEGVIVDGEGKLASAKIGVISDPAKLISLGESVRKKMEIDRAKVEAPTPTPAPKVEVAIAVLPPDAPTSKPELAADPVEGFSTLKANAIEAYGTVVPTTPIDVQIQSDRTLHTDAPKNSIPKDVDGNGPDATAETPKRRGRPAGSKNKPPIEIVSVTGTTVQDAGSIGEPAPLLAVQPELAFEERRSVRGPLPNPAADKAVSVYMDVIVDGVETQSLDSYIRTVSDNLCAAWGCKDVRLAPNNTEGGYNRGPVILALACAENPPAPGNYYVDTRANPLGEAVAVALRDACVASGGVFVRGVR